MSNDNNPLADAMAAGLNAVDEALSQPKLSSFYHLGCAIQNAKNTEWEIRTAFVAADNPYLQELLLPLIGTAAGLVHALERLASLTPRNPTD